MPDQVKLPIVGEVKTTWLYVGGALVLGIVGYAWYQHSQQAAATSELAGGPEDLADYGGGLQTGTPGTTTPGLPAGGETPTDSPDEPGPPKTNAQWFQRAVDYLGNIGYDPTAVSSAIGKYLARDGLTPAEADIVRVAVGALGTPPVGEYRIIPIGTPSTPLPPKPPPNPTPAPRPTVDPVPPAPHIHHVTPAATSAVVGWNPAPYATAYTVYVGTTAKVTVTGLQASVSGLLRNTSYTFTVKAKNKAGHLSPASNAVTVKTTK